jgi:hypothetical protein
VSPPQNGRVISYGSDTGQFVNGDYGISSADEYPMITYNNSQRAKPDRGAPTCDQDFLPRQFRQYVNVGVRDVQINNGLRWRVGAGLRIGYAGSGFLYGIVPQIPGQTRDNAAGFHPRGPSPYNISDLYQNGPGSQPVHPGGPGKIAGPSLYNPMSG